MQATILAVEKDRIRADMYLTPGTAVSPRVLADIDADRNGVVSESEQRAYATRGLAELSLTLNGTRLKPRLVSIEFPQVGEMKEGLGDIHLEFEVDLPRSGANRTLRLENQHQSRIAVYQVNCLVARDPDIRIGAQRRDHTQCVYELDQTDLPRTSPATTGGRMTAALKLNCSCRAALSVARRRFVKATHRRQTPNTPYFIG